MKKLILLVSILNFSTSHAAEVCRTATSFNSDTKVCIARALCTDKALYLEKSEYRLFGESRLGCIYAEAQIIKELLNLGYKIETHDTLVKY